MMEKWGARYCSSVQSSEEERMAEIETRGIHSSVAKSVNFAINVDVISKTDFNFD